jgi:Protein of unknown function (DUF1552)
MSRRSAGAREAAARGCVPLGRRAPVNRRAFLRVGAVAIGLPFLEGLPERSAWAADNAPVFSLFIVAANGVVQPKFFPSATGPLTAASLGAMTDKATGVLAPHAEHLLFVKNVNLATPGPTTCSHAQAMCQALTAAPPEGPSNKSYSTGPSADVVIAERVNPAGVEPLTLYAGAKGGYIDERISFAGAGMGQTRSAESNPYALYAQLVGLATPAPGGPPIADPLAAELLLSRKSVNDLVRNQLSSLLGSSRISTDDRQRLKQHFEAIRDLEVTMGEMGAACTEAGLATSQLDALKDGLAFKSDGMIEDVAKLHLELVALAFACNFNRVATLQHGDGADQTKYKVPSNEGLNWPFHHISHRAPSDALTGTNATAEKAHAEIDVLRMQTLRHGLDHFAARGLLDKSVVLWMSQIADGPSHSFRNVPHIIAGSGGGYLKQGAYVDAGSTTNNKLLNALISAAVRDKMQWTENFGNGSGSGELDVLKA